MDTTHEVFNQPEPLLNYKLFEGNRALRDALKFNAPGLDTAGLFRLGARLGTADMQAHARLANVHLPELHTHDRFDRRIDEVEFHPSYHALMAASVGAGLHGAPWANHESSSPHVLWAATGYVKEGGEGIMARIYREMPVNSIWECAGNIMALDLLRALRKPDAVAALAQELRAAQGAHPALDRLASVLPVRLEEMASELQARRLAQDVALALQAALLCQVASRAMPDAFCDSRLAGHCGQTFGTLPSGTDFDGIIGRAMTR